MVYLLLFLKLGCRSFPRLCNCTTPYYCNHYPVLFIVRVTYKETVSYITSVRYYGVHGVDRSHVCAMIIINAHSQLIAHEISTKVGQNNLMHYMLSTFS